MIRKCFSLLSAILLIIPSFAWAQWYHQNPLPPPYKYMSSVCFPSANVGWAVGHHGTIMKTTDAGATWASLYAGVMDTLYGVSFGSESIGSIVTNKGKIITTTNGGTTWNVAYSDSTKPLYSLYYASSTTAWAVGVGGTVLKTTNGGASWSKQSSGTGKSLYAVTFISSSVGWAVGTGRIILKTTDGGSSWVIQNDGTSNFLFSVFFISSTTGWVAGDQGNILKTTDGGATWTGQSISVSNELRGIYFTSATNGTCVGNNCLLRTTDGGTNWTAFSLSIYAPMLSICFSSSTNGWIVGDYGVLLRSTDGGVNWSSYNLRQRQLLKSIKFSTALNGVAVGDNGRILRTADGGKRWSYQIADSTKALNTVFFATPDTGWIVGEGGKCLKTVDSGKTWTSMSINTTNNLNSAFFVSSQKGWVVGNSGTIFMTSDGGSSWTQQITSVSSVNFSYVYFSSPTSGAIYYNDSYYLRTTDGGKYWARYSGGRSDMSAISFVTPKIGWMVGNYYAFKTIDGGASWVYVSLPTNSVYLQAVHFVNPSTGWITGQSGHIYHTIDGGKTWTDQTETEPNRSITYRNLLSICSVSPSTVWIAGDDGTILSNTNAGGPWLTLTSPAGGESWIAGSTKTITWKQSGVSNIKIEYSSNNGSTWQNVVSSTAANTGSYNWTVPSYSSTTCRIKISDISNAAESVVSADAFSVIPVPMIKVIAPAGGESWTVSSTKYIKWTDSSVTRLRIDYSTNNGSTWNLINASVDSQRDSLAWVVPNTPSSQCKVRIMDSSNAAVRDSSHSAFTIPTIGSAVISISAPMGGERWEAGTQHAITWVSANISNIKIEYSTNYGSNWKLLISSTPGANGSYLWTVPNDPTEYCMIRVSDVTNSAVSSTSPAIFAIFSRTISIVSPAGGENLKFGTIQNITWSATNVDSVKIDFSSDNGATWSEINSSVVSVSSSYPWLIDRGPSTQCRIRVSSAGQPLVRDSSHAAFTIYKPYITVTSPNGGENWVAGTTHAITWTSQNVTNVRLEFSSDKGVTWGAITNSVNASTGTYNWSTPNTPFTYCKIKITDVSNSALWDTSASTFSVSPAVVLLKDSLAFGSTYVYNSVKLYFTLTNYTSAMQFVYLSSNSSVFSVKSTYATVPGNSSTTVPVTFLPISTGVQSGRIILTCDPYPTDTVYVTGSGKAITYPTQITLSKTFGFPSNPVQNDYRLISLPGKYASTVDQVMTGIRGKDWNVYWDNGQANNYFVEFTDTGKFSFSPGIGYWTISKNNISVSKQVATADIITNYSYKIPIHRGWNIIANPFEKTVQWSRVISMSGLDTNSVIYDWSGSWAVSSQLLPYKAYYYQNVSGPDTLKFPYDPDGSLGKTGTETTSFNLGGQYVSLALSRNEKVYSTVTAGFDNRATDTYDNLDCPAPAGDFEIAGLRILCHFSENPWPQYFVEHRREIGAGQQFDLQLKNETKDDLTISLSALNNISGDVQVYLFDKRLNRFANLRGGNQYTVSGLHNDGLYSLLIGSSEFIAAESERLRPKSFEVFQNYPNPFNPSTLISYQLPVNELVTVKIFDILGKEITTLVNERQDPGIHELQYDAGKLSSGVYIYEIKAGKFKQAKKLMLLK